MTPSTPGMPEWERDLLGTPHPALNTTPGRDRALSLARTFVPILWGLVLTFTATRFPVIHSWVSSQEAVILPALEAVVTGLWYAVWRWTEAHLPAWLTRLLLGANTQPVYPAVVNGEAHEVG